MYHNLFKGTCVPAWDRLGASPLFSPMLTIPSNAKLLALAEGVLVAKKDFYSVWTYKSPEGDKDISLPNLEVINLLKSLKSSGYVKETFNWCARLACV